MKEARETPRRVLFSRPNYFFSPRGGRGLGKFGVFLPIRKPPGALHRRRNSENLEKIGQDRPGTQILTTPNSGQAPPTPDAARAPPPPKPAVINRQRTAHRLVVGDFQKERKNEGRKRFRGLTARLQAAGTALGAPKRFSKRIFV